MASFTDFLKNLRDSAGEGVERFLFGGIDLPSREEDAEEGKTETQPDKQRSGLPTTNVENLGGSPVTVVDEFIKKTNQLLSSKEKTDQNIFKPERILERDIKRQMSGGDFDSQRLLDQLVLHEGIRNKAYTDSEGVRTVGVGFNLDRPDAKAKIEKMGLDFDKVYSGEQTLTDRQTQALFEETVLEAIGDARQLVDNFDSLDPIRQRVLVDMAFNLGREKLSRFKNTLAAIERGDFIGAARGMRNSLWFEQVKTRGVRLASMMETGRDLV